MRPTLVGLGPPSLTHSRRLVKGRQSRAHARNQARLVTDDTPSADYSRPMSESWDASAAYLDAIREELPLYDRLQDQLIRATYGVAVRRILDLGAGTGETSRRALLAYPDAELIAIDPSQDLLKIARGVLPEQAQLRLGFLDEPLPKGSFDLIISALTIQTLPPHQRIDLFPRIRRALAPRGRLVVGDIVGGEAVGRLSAVDRTDSLAALQARMRDGGLNPSVAWAESGLAVISATV